MNEIVIESSSDDDDTYTNPAARLRALKEKRLRNEERNNLSSIAATNNITYNKDDVIIINTDVVPNDILDERDIQTEIRITRSKSKNIDNGRSRNINTSYPAVGSTKRSAERSTKTSVKKPPFINTLEMEIVPLQNKTRANSVSESAEDIIALSSDDDACGEDDNYEINIKVLWRSNRLDRLNMRRHDNFLKIFQHYADLEKVSVNEILITRNDKIISHVDTPALLNLSVIDILDGGIVNPGMNTVSCEDKNDNEDDVCSIKVQTANKKQSLIVPLKKNEQFRALFSYCASQLSENKSNLKFYFDGEQIGPTDTPESLDMEGEACIDLQISSL